MSKKICEWSKKKLEKKRDLLHTLTRDAHLYCGKCGRVANVRKALCKPKPFSEESETKDAPVDS